MLANAQIVALGLLYGEGDFTLTMKLAFAMGYDADCNAATAGAVLGYRLGFAKIAALPQFKMPDRYVNKTRPELPAECKVSEQVETLLRAVERHFEPPRRVWLVHRLDLEASGLLLIAHTPQAATRTRTSSGPI